MVCWGALTNFPVNDAKIFYFTLGVQVHPLHPLATPMAINTECGLLETIVSGGSFVVAAEKVQDLF